MTTTPVDQLRRGRTTLVLDTNAVYSDPRLMALCTQVNRLNESPYSLALRVCVPSLVYMEKLHDIHQRLRARGRSFNLDEISRSLQAKGIQVLSFDVAQAATAAAWLAESFPSEDAWRTAKLRLNMRKLGIREEPAQRPRCSATIDWPIASYGRLADHILVTDDTGLEFHGIPQKLRLEQLERALAEMLRSPATGRT